MKDAGVDKTVESKGEEKQRRCATRAMKRPSKKVDDSDGAEKGLRKLDLGDTEIDSDIMGSDASSSTSVTPAVPEVRVRTESTFVNDYGLISCPTTPDTSRVFERSSGSSGPAIKDDFEPTLQEEYTASMKLYRMVPRGLEKTALVTNSRRYRSNCRTRATACK